MGSLTYTANTSLDGYTVDRHGKFDWTAPSEEVHAFINDLERPVGLYLYGRRLYETMKVWQTYDPDSVVAQDYGAIWRAARKIVYSATLSEVETPDTTLERVFDPAEVAELKAAQDISIGGATLAAEALRAGLVDVVRLFVNPVSIGNGTAALPADLRVDLELLEERRFANGAVYLHYRVRSSAS